jgi:hypothetical protein
MMLCPCCGSDMLLGAFDCRCGARFVGEPLSDPAVKLQRFGPAVTAIGLLVVVVAAALLFTKFLAIGAVVVVLAARKAMRLAQRDPESYGGYRTAAATLAVTLTAGAVLGGLAIAGIPRLLRDREDKGTAGTCAPIYRYYQLIEEYKVQTGSYPLDEATVKRFITESLPRDYWNKAISYQGRTDYMVGTQTQRTGVPINNFELRSAGPDEKLETDDDIVMIDGIFYTNAEAKKKSVMQRPVNR